MTIGNGVGIGITSYARPEYLEKCAKSMKRNLFVSGRPVFWKLAAYNDGSPPKHHAAYERAYKPIRSMGGRILEGTTNGGVAVAKNALITHLLSDPEVSWVLLVEDDILATDPRAVTEYVRITESAGIEHLSWAGHGPANAGGPVAVDGDVAFYYHAVGAWSLYSRRVLEEVGTFDENFHNAWEHCELTLRIAAAGYTSGAYRYADATHANEWLSEIPNSIENSSIRGRDDWSSSISNGLRYWRDNRKDTFNEIFGPGMPLEQYARSIIG